MHSSQIRPGSRFTRDDEGVHDVWISVTDQNGAADTTVFQLAIIDPMPNATPRILTTSIRNETVYQTYRDTLAAADSDTHDTLTFELLDPPVEGLVIRDSILAAGLFFPGDVGDHDLVVRVFDGHGAADTVVFSWRIIEAVGIRLDLHPIVRAKVQVSPNPFNSKSIIRFDLTNSAWVTLSIYNVTEQRVAELVASRHKRGYHSAVWDGRDGNGREVESGVYLVRLVVGDDVRTVRVILLH